MTPKVKRVATYLRRLDAIGPTARPALAVKTFSRAGWKFANKPLYSCPRARRSLMLSCKPRL